MRPQPARLLWRSRPFVDGEYGLGLVPAGDVICAGDGFGNIYGLDAAVGTTLWRRTFRDNSSGYLPLAAGGGVLYVAETAGRGGVAALDVRTGRLRWAGPVPSVASTLVVLDSVIAGTPAASPSYDAGELTFALDKATGRLLWQARFGEGTYSRIAGEGDRVYVQVDLLNGAVTEGTEIYAVAARSGATLWRRTFPSQYIGGLIAAFGGRLYGGFREGVLRALSPATGAVIWQRPTVALVTSITPGPRVLYVDAAGPPDTIYAIGQ